MSPKRGRKRKTRTTDYSMYERNLILLENLQTQALTGEGNTEDTIKEVLDLLRLNVEFFERAGV